MKVALQSESVLRVDPLFRWVEALVTEMVSVLPNHEGGSSHAEAFCALSHPLLQNGVVPCPGNCVSVVFLSTDLLFPSVSV